MFGISTWLAGWDQFGSWAKFNYRGEAGYGTGYGGFCSLVVNIIATLFIFVQLTGFVFSPSYNQTQTTVYLATGAEKSSDPYTIYQNDFIPTFAVHMYHDEPGTEEIDYWWLPTDQQYFNVYYEQYDYGSDADPIKYDAILCTDYISSWDVADDQKQAALGEIEYPDYQLCPDTQSYILKGGTRSLDRMGLRFRIDPMENAGYDYTPGTGADLDRIDDTNIYSSMMNRYFAPRAYND